MVRILPVAALALTLTPQLAAAHGDEPHPALTIVAPVDGDDDVPTNTLVWLDETSAEFADGTSELRLRGPDNDEILVASSSEITTPVGTITVWQPERQLLPDARYVLWQCSQTACEQQLGEFRTRSGPTDAEPPVPTETKLVEAADLITTDADYHGLLIVAAGPDDLDPDERTGDILAVGLPGQPLAFHAHQSVNSVHLGVYDLAGNFSGFTDSLSLEREKSPVSAACSVTDDPPMSLLTALLLLALPRRRRIRASP